jgi:hypothetical protein
MAVLEKKVSHVTYDGRTVVDTDALLQDPKVRETISKLRARGFFKRRAAKILNLKKKP